MICQNCRRREAVDRYCEECRETIERFYEYCHQQDRDRAAKRHLQELGL